MNSLENKMFADGFVRDPNKLDRWYAGHAGKLEPVFPLELRVTDKVWIVARGYANCGPDVVPLLAFDGPEDLNRYLSSNGHQAEAAAAFSNSWD